MIENPSENFPKFSPYHICPYHSQAMEMAETIVGFAELPEWHLHYDPVLDSLYITASCRFRLYIFFVVTLLFLYLAPYLIPQLLS